MSTPKPADVSSQAFWSRPFQDRAATFAELRRTAPVSFQEPSDLGLTPQTKGFWAVTRHADVVHVSRTPEVFCSGRGVGLGEAPVELLELNASFLVMDPPRHTEMRRIVSRAFTPRRVAELDEAITAQATRAVDGFVDSGGGEVVGGLSTNVPLWTISTMMGVPEHLRQELFDAAEGQIEASDPEIAARGIDGASVAVQSAMTLHRIAAELVEERRAAPTDDILSTLVASEVDGRALTPQELGAIFCLFASAGNDTTRTATSHGVKLFSDHPDQWDRLAADRSLLPTAIEEIIRWSTPVIHFRRTATVDTELAGASIREGDAVVMFYESANRDEEVFDEPGSVRHRQGSEPARRLRWRRPPLLPRRQPGPGTAPSVVRSPARSRRTLRCRRTRPPDQQLRQRHQAHARDGHGSLSSPTDHTG